MALISLPSRFPTDFHWDGPLQSIAKCQMSSRAVRLPKKSYFNAVRWKERGKKGKFAPKGKQSKKRLRSWHFRAFSPLPCLQSVLHFVQRLKKGLIVSCAVRSANNRYWAPFFVVTGQFGMTWGLPHLFYIFFLFFISGSKTQSNVLHASESSGNDISICVLAPYNRKNEAFSRACQTTNWWSFGEWENAEAINSSSLRLRLLRTLLQFATLVLLRKGKKGENDVVKSHSFVAAGGSKASEWPVTIVNFIIEACHFLEIKRMKWNTYSTTI